MSRHELRTPLTSITGYVETLLDHEQTLSPTAQEFLTTILKNATRMNRLTEDLLVMARIESSEQELHPAPIPADLLVRDAVQAMKGLVQDTEAVLEIGNVTERQVYADQDAVLQVLGNLIENAIKYGRTKGNSFSRVVVSAGEVSEPYEAVEFRVRDFGQGDRVGAPESNLRAVLQGGQGEVEGVRRDGAGAGDREAHGADPGRGRSGRRAS